MSRNSRRGNRRGKGYTPEQVEQLVALVDKIAEMPPGTIVHVAPVDGEMQIVPDPDMLTHKIQ